MSWISRTGTEYGTLYNGFLEIGGERGITQQTYPGQGGQNVMYMYVQARQPPTLSRTGLGFALPTLRHAPVLMFQLLMVASAPAVYRILPLASVDMVVMEPAWPLKIWTTRRERSNRTAHLWIGKH